MRRTHLASAAPACVPRHTLTQRYHSRVKSLSTHWRVSTYFVFHALHCSLRSSTLSPSLSIIPPHPRFLLPLSPFSLSLTQTVYLLLPHSFSPQLPSSSYPSVSISLHGSVSFCLYPPLKSSPLKLSSLGALFLYPLLSDNPLEVYPLAL